MPAMPTNAMPTMPANAMPTNGGGFIDPHAQAPQQFQQQAPQQFHNHFQQQQQAPQPMTPQQAMGPNAPQPESGAATMSAAERAALAGLKMAGNRKERLPLGSYVVDCESSEFAMIGKTVQAKKRMLIGHVVVIESSNPSAPVGLKSKLSEFLDTDYKPEDQFAKFKRFASNMFGYRTEAEIDAHRDPRTGEGWLDVVQRSPGPFVGFRYAVHVKQKLDASKRPKYNADGTPSTYEVIQRIG
jgi:hypothetical protein